MKSVLQLNLTPQIAMTPQLQQAIRLLQLSNVELEMEIQQIVDLNFMLEIVEDANEIETKKTDENIETDIPNELPFDNEWADIYDDIPSSKKEIMAQDSLLNQKSCILTLQNYLQEQVDLAHFNNRDYASAIAIIDNIDNDGYLRADLDEIAEAFGEESHISAHTLELVLCRIQQFDPIGVGARDVQECLLLQLAEYDNDTPWLKEATVLVHKHLSVLGMHDYAQLSQKMRLSRIKLQEVIKLIQTLTPRPCAQISPADTTYVIPDVYITPVKETWKIELNYDHLPKVIVNSQYAKIRSKKFTEKNCLRTQLHEARWFIKSLKSRHETLLKVSTCIVERQSDFLKYGDEAMKPMVLHEIADELNLHESTISRITTQKYMHTPRGVFELKYFFSSHLGTQSGGECSSIAIRAIIRKLIESENTLKPYSDNKISQQLFEQGFKVARRTVAKYREAMFIPPSNKRKCLL
ncbi:MAG: RNA polymerase factor sigma-54 [Thiomargarita sp.]|nr:RNA polymerase factor sigma-54 [Thiomargarita sp.]